MEPKVERYVVIDASGRVVNAVVWDGESDWTPPEGCSVVQSDDREIYVEPVNPQAKAAEIAALKARVAELEKP